LANLLDQIAAAARGAGVPLDWSQRHGDPVAIVNLPVDQSDPEGFVVVEHLELNPGELVLSGNTIQTTAPSVDESGSDTANDQSRLADGTDDTASSQR
jgi:hypothetical protein